MRSSSIVLLSGGLDSTAAFYWALQESDLMLGLTFDYGQRAREAEIKAARKICKKNDIQHRVIELPWFSAFKVSALLDPTLPIPEIKKGNLDSLAHARKSAQAVWVPNRNGVFINVAAALAEAMVANWLVVGFNREEGRTFPDNSQEYLDSANEALKYSTQGNVRLCAPMQSKNKKQIVEWCLKNKVDLSDTWSCYQDGDKMCGRCESCLRSLRAYEEAGAHAIPIH